MVKENPLVSIIIPFFNSRDYLIDTVNSAIHQTWKNKEIILINDGSFDGSLEIARRFSSDNVKVLSQENSGASSARNAGISFSKGDFIQFLDADDILATSKIEEQLIQLFNEPAESIASGPFINFIDTIENSQPIKADNGYTSFDQPVDWLVLASSGKAMFPPLVWLTPRKLIEQSGPWNEMLSYNDDSEFFARILLKAKKIAYCEEALSYYRRGNPKSLGSQTNYKARKSEFDSLNLVTKHLLKFENSDRVRQACAFQYSKLYFSLYPEYKLIRNDIKQRLVELNVNIKFNFGQGITHKIGKLIGWRTAKWLRYYSLKIIKILHR